ncbi:MAG TPA: hypothetical protein VEL28_02320 [Candidatus Binatia bacterium]|nr:hypothetical protein [Candidatus Binatia bacterium]
MTSPSAVPAGGRYRRLDPECIVSTADRLWRRIRERFPDRGLCSVADQVRQVATEAHSIHSWAHEPRIGMRIAAGLIVATLAAIELGTAYWLYLQREAANWSDYIQGIDATVNSVILSAGAIVFLVTAERRHKRRRILKALHELRALAHVIEMHQLAKDPKRTFPDVPSTESSPERDLSAPELNRYLDYCSELLAIVGNIAALYAQGDDDQVTLDAADAIASLCTGISQKIWQKMRMVTETASADLARATAVAAPPAPEEAPAAA